MALVGVNNEPLLERAVFGFDGTSYRVVKVDTDGNIVVAQKVASGTEVTQDTPADLQATVTLAASQEIEVTQTVAADLKATVTIPTGQDVEARAFGWIASAWQKSGLLLGYMGDVDEDLAVTATGSPTVIDSTVVPANTVHVIDNGTISNETRNGSTGFINIVKNSGTTIRVFYKSSPLKLVPMMLPRTIVLSPGDKVSFRWAGSQSGDLFIGGLTGYYFTTNL